jgi:hypothetical protein
MFQFRQKVVPSEKLFFMGSNAVVIVEDQLTFRWYILHPSSYLKNKPSRISEKNVAQAFLRKLNVSEHISSIFRDEV